MKNLLSSKKVFIGLMAAALVVGLSTVAGAVSGPCDDCHTMHNSQDGSNMGPATPQPMLLRGTDPTNSCFGCHVSGGTNGALVAPHGPQVAAAGGGVPLGGALAGGYFSDEGSMGNTHDVLGLSTGDTDIAANLGANFPPGGAAALIGQLNCAGTDGCHGGGGHHANAGNDGSTALNGATTGTSFRFLTGVRGIEDTDYEFSTTATDHNVYIGTFDRATTFDDINDLCASCHGTFHTGQDSGGNWVRHPTDEFLNDSGGGIAAEHQGYTVYNAEVPVGTTNAATFSDPQAAGNGYVLCISCHRAHGSAESDLLRWTYSDMEAGTTGAAGGTGCFRCHTLKDGV